MRKVKSLGHSPYNPGDTIRDRKTGIDYVVQSIAGAAIGAGLTIYALHLYTGKVAEFKLDTLDAEDLIMKRRSPKPQRADDVINRNLEREKFIAQGDQQFLTKLNSQEGQIYRDLLQLGDDVDPVKFKKALVDLADVLAGANREVRQGEIFSILRDVAPDGIYDLEYLELLAENISSQARFSMASRLIPSKSVGFFSKNQLSNFLFSKEGVAARSDYSILKKYSIGLSSPNVHDLRGRNAGFVNTYIRTEEDLRNLAEKSIRNLGGTYGEITHEVISKEAAVSFARMKRGQHDGMLRMILESNPDDIVGDYNTIFARTSTSRAAPWLWKARGSRHSSRFKKWRPDLNIKAVLDNPDLMADRVLLENGEEGFNVLSISQEAFTKNVAKANSQKLADGIAKDFGPNIYTTPKVLRNLNQKITEGMELGEEDLSILRETHTRIKGSIRPDDILEIQNRHLGNLVTRGEDILKLTLNGDPLDFVPHQPLERWNALSNVESPLERLHRFFGNEPQAADTRRMYTVYGKEGMFGSLDEAVEAHFSKGEESLSLGHIRYVDVPHGATLSNLQVRQMGRPLTTPQFASMKLNASLKGKSAVESISNMIASDQLGLERLTASRQSINAHLQHLNTSLSSDKLAIMHLHSAGESRFAIIGTELNRAVEDQIALGMKLKERGGGLLDIETGSLTTAGGTQKTIRELALGGSNGDMFFRSASTIEEEAALLKETAQHIGRFEVIGTHSNYDFRVLTQRAHQLGTQMGDEELIRAGRTFEEFSQSKLFNTEVLFQLAGHPLGKTSQEHLMTHYGIRGGKQIHGAKEDIEDLWKLINKVDLDGVNYQIFRGEELAKKNLMYFTPPGGTTDPGSLRKLVGLRNKFVDGEHQVEAIFQRLGFSSEGKLIEGGLVSTVHKNVFTLGAELNIKSVLVDETNIKEIHAVYQEVIEDLAGRKTRNLNPLSRKVPLVPTEGGAYAQLQLKGDRLARELLPDIRDTIGEHYNLLDNIKAQADPNRLERVVNEALTSKRIETPDLRNYVKQTLIQAIEDPNAEKILTSSSYSKVLDSPFGKELAKIAQEDPSSGFMALFWAETMHDAADSPDILRKMITPSRNPSFQLMQSSRAFNDLDQMGADVVLRAGFKGHESREEARRWLADVGYNEEEIRNIRSLSHRFNVARNTREGTGNWYTALSELQYEAEGSEFHPLVEAANRILSHEKTKTIVTDKILEKQATFIQHSEYGTAMERTEFSNKLIEQLKLNLNSSANVSEGWQNFMRTMHSGTPEDAEKLSEFLRDIYPEWTDTDKHLAGLSEEQVAEISKRARTIWENIDEHGTGSSLSDILTLAMGEHSKVYESGERGRTLLRAYGSSIHENTASADTIKAVHARVVEAQGVASRVASQGKTEVQILAEAVNTAGAGAIPTGLVERTHEAVLKTAGKRMAGEAMSSVGAPLLVVGGLIGMLAAFSPKENYSVGEASERAGFRGGDVARYSEIPGNNVSQTVWHGETNPFRLNISFKGYVRDSQHKDELINKVYNILNGEVEVRQFKNSMRDNRVMSHRQSAREILRV